MDNIYEYTKIRDNIWQIEEDNSVCCTLVKGREMAVLIDTGYGVRNLREFVEKHIITPYYNSIYCNKQSWASRSYWWESLV